MPDSSHGLDALPILRALDLRDVGSVAPVSGGADMAIWRIERGNATYALRVFRPEQAMACSREVAAMEAAGAAGIPVPHVQAHGHWNDRPALLLAWRPGRPLFHQLLAHPWQAGSLGRTFGRMQAAIHAVPAPPALLQDRRSWVDELPPSQVTLRERLQNPDIRRDALLHLDYHPLNVLVEDGRITGVLDWTNTRAGDPRIDLARTKTILHLDMGRPRRHWLANAALEPLWRAFEWGWWQGYREVARSGDNLALFYAAAGALMEQDLGQRYAPQQLAHVRRWTRWWQNRASARPPRLD